MYRFNNKYDKIFTDTMTKCVLQNKFMSLCIVEFKVRTYIIPICDDKNSQFGKVKGRKNLRVYHTSVSN